MFLNMMEETVLFFSVVRLRKIMKRLQLKKKLEPEF